MIWDILILVVCAALWRMGGTDLGGFWRDFWIPIILGVYVGIGLVWWVGVLTFFSLNIIRVGYGIEDRNDGDPGSTLYRIFKEFDLPIPWLVRGTAGLLYILVGLLPYVAYTRRFDVYLGLAGLSFLVNALSEKMRLNVWVAEPLAACVVAAVAFFV